MEDRPEIKQKKFAGEEWAERPKIKRRWVPGGIIISSEPKFSSNAFIRYTKEGGEDFPCISQVVDREGGALWFGGTAEGWVPRVLGLKKGEAPRYFGALRREISVKAGQRSKK